MKLCVIPARGGSKRIPHKNIKLFHSKPMICYSIENALKTELFDKIIVSTDSVEIADVVKKYDVEIQLRPDYLSDDFVGLDKVIEFVLSKNRGYKFVCLLFATAVLLDYRYIIDGYEKLKDSDAIHSISVVENETNLFRSFKIENGRMKMFFPENYFKRSQDLPLSYRDAGAFSWKALERISFNKVTFSNESIPIVLPRYMGIDIDTIDDFKMAEIVYKVINDR